MSLMLKRRMQEKERRNGLADQSKKEENKLKFNFF